VNSGIGAKPTWRHVCSAVHARLCSVAVHPDGVHELWPKLQIRITQLAREGSAPPGLRLPQTKLSRNSNQVARGRIRRFVRHAQPASAVSVTHVQAEKIVATRCPLGNRHDPHCTSTSAPRESAAARGASGVRPVDLAARVRFVDRQFSLFHRCPHFCGLSRSPSGICRAWAQAGWIMGSAAMAATTNNLGYIMA